jgi:chitodextrinase
MNTSTETNYTVTGLTFSTDYTFTVKSKDAGNLSKASTSETLTTKVLSPTQLCSRTKTTSSSVLNWTAPADSTDVVGYNVYNGDELEYATTSTETNYTVTGLTSSTDYTFYSEIDKAGNLSDASNVTKL